mgnify:FL=1
MSRLIDADKLILHLNDYALQEAPFGYNDSKCQKEIYETIQECMKAVEEQPTAFDAEKVIEEFENLREVELHMCDELVVGDADAQYNDGVSQGRYEAFIEAIEIVKRGGRDEE